MNYALGVRYAFPRLLGAVLIDTREKEREGERKEALLGN